MFRNIFKIMADSICVICVFVMCMWLVCGLPVKINVMQNELNINLLTVLTRNLSDMEKQCKDAKQAYEEMLLKFEQEKSSRDETQELLDRTQVELGGKSWWRTQQFWLNIYISFVYNMTKTHSGLTLCTSFHRKSVKISNPSVCQYCIKPVQYNNGRVTYQVHIIDKGDEGLIKSIEATCCATFRESEFIKKNHQFHFCRHNTYSLH